MTLITSRQGLNRATEILVVASVLLWPAVYNRFPIIFPDTTAYLSVALSHSWTLDRSGFYGLFLKPFFWVDSVGGAWIAVGLQTCIIAAILIATSARAVPKNGWAMLSVLLVTATLTSLPWHASQLMPDAFTGPLVLLSWLAASRRLDQPGTALMWLATTGLMLLHYTHLVIVPVVVLTTLAARYCLGDNFKKIPQNAVALVLCLAAAIGAQVSANGLMFNRWTVSPMGTYFLFARLQADGLIPDWMQRHCGRDGSPELCSIEAQMPRNSQLVLWGGKTSPLDSRINAHLATPESWAWVNRLERPALEAIEEEPLRFGGNVLHAGVSQFFHFRAIDDECPQNCGFPGLTKSVPRLGEHIKRSRQVEDRIPRTEIRAVSSALSILGLLMLLPTIIVAVRRRDAEILSLVTCITMALLANALMTGGLSDVHDRYQSRIVWLAPFAVMLALLRWLERDRARSTSDACHPTPISP